MILRWDAALCLAPVSAFAVQGNPTSRQRSQVLLQGAGLDRGIVFGLVKRPPHEDVVAQADVADPRALRRVCAVATDDAVALPRSAIDARYSVSL